VREAPPYLSPSMSEKECPPHLLFPISLTSPLSSPPRPPSLLLSFTIVSLPFTLSPPPCHLYLFTFSRVPRPLSIHYSPSFPCVLPYLRIFSLSVIYPLPFFPTPDFPFPFPRCPSSASRSFRRIAPASGPFDQGSWFQSAFCA